MKESQIDRVLQALANPVRRQILDIVRDHPGCNVSLVAGCFDSTRIAIMKHLRVLEDAELIITEKHGRNRHLYRNLVPIQLIYDRWTDEFSAYWSEQLADIKYRVEGKNNER